MKLLLIKLLCILPIFGGLFIVIFKQYEWYDKYKGFYHIWFIPTTLFILSLIPIYYINYVI